MANKQSTASIMNEIFGESKSTKKEKGMRHYNLGELFLVGEATALAMRTNVKR